RNIRARRFDSTKAIASCSLMVLLRFARCARASAGESLNRTTFPFTTAVACMMQTNRKPEADNPSRLTVGANIHTSDCPNDLAHHSLPIDRHFPLLSRCNALTIQPFTGFGDFETRSLPN